MTTSAHDITSVPEKPKRKKRIFMWTFLAVQVLFLFLVIGGINSGSGHATDCGSLSQSACDSASDVGTGIGVMLLIGMWFFVDCFLAVGYAVYRMAKRP